MKKRLAMLFLVLTLVAGNAWAVPDGIWKNTTGSPAYNFYVQTYVGNNMLVVIAPNAEVFWAFMDADADYTNGFEANEDMNLAPRTLTINFISDDRATAELTFENGWRYTYMLERTFKAPYTE